MAQSEAPFQPAPAEPARARKWPLAGVMAIDFVIAIVAFVGLTLLAQLLFLGLRVAQLGISLDQLRAKLVEPTEVLRLIGADGLFATLLLTNAAFILVPIVRVKLIRHEPLAEIGFRAERPLRLVGIGIGLGVLSLVVNAAAGALFRQYGVEPDQAAQFPLFRGDYLGQALFMIGAAVLAPIGEEVLFRGYVFNALNQTFGSRAWGVPLAYVVSALLFSGVHYFGASQGVIGLLVPLFLIGLLLAWAMHTTKSLIPCIIAHAINNGVALIALITCINTPGLSGCPTL